MNIICRKTENTYNRKLPRKIQGLITIIHVCDDIVYDGALLDMQVHKPLSLTASV